MDDSLHIDNLDRKILSYITKNARTAFLEVARECGVSGAAVHQRIQKLTHLGVILGSEFIVDPQTLGYHTRAFIGIYLEKASMNKYVVSELQKIPEVVECHYTTGGYSIFIKVITKNNEHLKNILADKLQAIDGITRTETFISLVENIKRQLPIEIFDEVIPKQVE